MKKKKKLKWEVPAKEIIPDLQFNSMSFCPMSFFFIIVHDLSIMNDFLFFLFKPQY